MAWLPITDAAEEGLWLDKRTGKSPEQPMQCGFQENPQEGLQKIVLLCSSPGEVGLLGPVVCPCPSDALR